MATAQLRALSLWNPWAWLVVNGHKQWETRSRQIHYRGFLLIHASMKWTTQLQRLCYTSPFAEVLQDNSMRFGAFVGICRVVNCAPTEKIRGWISEREYAFGDYSNGRYAIHLHGAKALPEPIPAPGHQFLWIPHDKVWRQVRDWGLM